jgi:hypothetical protein
MADSPVDRNTLKAMRSTRIEVHDPRYEVEEIVGGGEFLYDPQVFWEPRPSPAWTGPEGSILISDIGGQPAAGWDPDMGHGGIFRLHADNRFETLMAQGVGRQAGVFRPIISPPDWGDFGDNIFFCSQSFPGRPGAIWDHVIYRLPPGADKPIGFGVPPRSGTRGKGISGALMPGVFGRPGTPEEGLFLIISMHNCTIYAATPVGEIFPWLVMDGVGGPGPLMPYRLYYAHEAVTGVKDMLVVEGPWGTSFGDQNHTYAPAHYRVADGTVHPEPVEALAGGPGPIAPPSFGPYAGQMFRTDNAGFISSVHWTKGNRQALPYTDTLWRREADGSQHLFASGIQAGQNLIGFAGDRLIITNLHHSYSSGDFHEPDGSVHAIRYKGG